MRKANRYRQVRRSVVDGRLHRSVRETLMRSVAVQVHVVAGRQARFNAR